MAKTDDIDKLIRIGVRAEVDRASLKKTLDQMRTIGGSASVDVSKELAKIAKEMSTKFSGAVEKGVSMGYSSTRIDKMRVHFEALTGEYAKVYKEVAAIDAKLKDKALGQNVREQLEAARTIAGNAMKGLEREIKGRTEMEDKLAKIRETNAEKLAAIFGTNMLETTEKAAEGMEKVANNLVSIFKNGDVEGFVKGAIGAVKKGAETAKMSAESRLAAAGPEGAKGMAAMSKNMGRLAVAAGALAAVVGTIAVIAKVLMDADSQAKEFNKSLLESGGAMALLTGRTEGLQEQMNEVRQAAVDFRFNLQYGSTLEMNQQILASYIEQGISLGRMAGHLDDVNDRMVQYQRYSRIALTYSRLLGVQQSEVAEGVAGMQFNLAMNMESVESGFAAITRAASDSGYSVSRFSSMILQATSGMTLYNMRLEESAALLSSITKVLGMEEGARFFEDASATLRNDGAQDLIRRTMVLGTGNVRDLVAADAQQQMANIQSRSDFGALQSAFATATGADSPDSVAGIIASLDSMSSEDSRRVLSELTSTIGGDLVRNLESARNLQRGASGGVLDVSAAARNMSPAAAAEFRMQEANRALGFAGQELGGTGSRAIDSIGIAAAESLGIQAEELDRLQRAYTYFGGQVTRLERAAAAGDLATVQEILGGDATISADGTAMLGGQAITDSQSLMLAQDEMLESIMGGTGAAVSEDLALSRQYVDNTRQMNQILENGIQAALERLVPIVQSIQTLIARWLPQGDDYVDEEQRATYLRGNMGQQRDQIARQNSLGATIQELTTQRDTESDPAVQQRLDEEISAATANYEESQRTLERLREQEEAARTATRGSQFSLASRGSDLATSQDLLREILGDAPLRNLRATGPFSKDADLEEHGFTREWDGNNMQIHRGGELVATHVATRRSEGLEEWAPIAEENTAATVQAIDDSAETIRDGIDQDARRRDREAAMNQIMAEFGAQGMGVMDIQRRMASRDFSGLSPSALEAASRAGMLSPVNDFIYQRGAVRPINREDQFVGMKPGGPVDRAMGNRGVNINIYGGDENRIYDVVRRAMREG